MKKAILALFGGMLFLPARGFSYGQEIYLGVSPDNRYRVVVRQDVLRRVEDEVFFRYPVEVVDMKTKKRLFVRDVPPPIVQETPRGTFQLDWEKAKMDWSKDSRFLLLQLEVLKGTWAVYRVDIEKASSREITPLLVKELAARANKKDWECEKPVFSVPEWVKPHRAVWRIETRCGEKDQKPQERKFEKYFHWAAYDLDRDEVWKTCLGCEEEKALKEFRKEPTPTPVPTPTRTDAERDLEEEEE